MDISVRYVGGKKVEATVKGHTVTTDQPERSGGEGSAPAPFDLFLASLATCAGYYVYDFCLARGISTDGIDLVMRTEKNGETKMISRISIEIRLPEAFPGKYEKAVVRAAELCSVKRHLFDPPTVETCATRRSEG